MKDANLSPREIAKFCKFAKNSYARRYLHSQYFSCLRQIRPLELEGIDPLTRVFTIAVTVIKVLALLNRC